MNYIKKSMLLPICIFVVVLGCIVGGSYRKNPYLINIQYQSGQELEQDGIEKIIVSDIEGVRKSTFEAFEYNEERERYEYEIDKSDSAYLNLFLDPFHRFSSKMEYRMKTEDSAIDPTDGIIVTVYSGSTPIQQEMFSLIDSGISMRYQPDWLMLDFMLLLFGSFIVCVISVLHTVHNEWKNRFLAGALVTAFWCVIWFGGLHAGVVIKRGVFNKFCFLLLGVVLLSAAGGIVRNAALRDGKNCVMERAKKTVPAIIFFAVTCIIYIPSSLYLGNINEFAMPYYRMAGGIFVFALFCFTILSYIGLKISNAKGQYIYTLVIFFITAGFYIQSNFLNPSLPDLNGEPINWDSFVKAKRVSWFGWGLLGIILIALISLALYKNVKIEKVISYLAGLLSLMQLCSLAVLIFSCRLDADVCRTLETEGQFTVGDENIVIFVVDCLQVDAVQTYIEKHEDAKETLEDFTLFENTIGGGAPTKYAVPLMLSGMEYDPMQDIDEYHEEMWQEGELLWDLKENQYDVRLYTEADKVQKLPSQLVENLKQTSGNDIENPVLFYRKLMQLSNFYMMPLCLKDYFWLSTDELKNCLENEGTGQNYVLDDVRFYDEFCQKHLQKRDGKTFRFYHLFGVHKPFLYDEQFNMTTEDNTSEAQAFNAVMMLIKMYMDEMKDLGVYDNSTIVILGDHGRHNTTDAEKYPAILLKMGGEDHPLQYSDHPVCFRNLVSTLESTIYDDYSRFGPTVFDINRESDVERLQTLDKAQTRENAQYSGELYADSETGARFIVDDDGVGNLTYREWNPYEINRISYTYGDVIDFRSSDFYADSLTERLYPVENGKTASNELTICFDLPEQKTGNLELGFTYAGVYNDTQKIRIYANGHKVDNVMCTTDQIGKETSVVIPKQYIKEKPVIVRMVFPNAVTPNQLDRSNPDTRVLSVTFDKMWLKVANS